MAYEAITNYAWDMGDGTTYSGAGYATVSHEYQDGGAYVVTLTITNGGGETATTTMLVRAGPKRGPFARQWTFHDGATSSAESVSKTYNDSGRYALTLTVTDREGQSDSSTMVVDAGAKRNIVSAQWQFGDGATDGGVSVSHWYDEEGFYSVQLDIVDAEGQTDTGYEFVQYWENSIASVAWNFGDGRTGSGRTTSHIYFPGSFTVTATITDTYGNSGTDTEQITVTGFRVKVSPVSGSAPLRVRCSV